MSSVQTTALRNRRRARWVGAALAAMALLGAACSSDSKTSSSNGSGSGGSNSSSVDLSVLGTPKPATGTPVTIGLITEGGSEAIGQQSDLTTQGANIAVQYVNEYLNGLNNHPINLFVCGNKSTPAGAQDCANQMVEKKVAAVVWPFTGQGASVPILTGAGIPIIAGSGASAEELTTPGVFVLTGGYPATLGAYALDAKQKGYKHFAMIITDVPAATQGATAIGGIVFKNAGVTFDVVPVAPGTPDLTPQMQDAVSKGADSIGVTGDVTFCTSFLKGYQTLSLTLPKYIISTCQDQSVVTALPDVLKGSIVATSGAPGTSPDQQKYAAMIAKYAPGKNIDPDPQKSSGVAAGVSTIMNFSNGMQGATGDPTPASITQQFKTVTAPLFLGGGVTFNCASKPIPLIPNICSATLLIGTANADGTVSDAKPIDPSALFKTG